MNPDDLIAAFNELDDPETRIDRTKVGDADTVRLVPSCNKAAVRRFKALAVDAAALFDPAGRGDPEARWLRFVLEHAPELVEDRHAHGPASLGYAIERHDDGTEWRVPFIAQTLPNAASASALVVRRCRHLIEQGELVEGAQAGVASAQARAVDPHAGELAATATADAPPDDLVTLDQAAAVVYKSKRTLERYLKQPDWPDPDLRGGGGKPHRWYWTNLRPALLQFRPDLPERFPASRFIG